VKDWSDQQLLRDYAERHSDATITTAAATIAGTTATAALIMTTLQKITVIAALTVTIGAGIYETRQADKARTEVQTLRQQLAPLATQNERLQKERDQANTRLAGMAGEFAKTSRNNLELLKLRAEVARMRYQPPATKAQPPATDDGDTDDLEFIKNARGVVLDGGTVLNFTNGVAIVPGADYPNSASDREQYSINRVLGMNGNLCFCDTSVDSGGSGTDVSLGIFRADGSDTIKSLQMLDVGDRVQIYNYEQDDGQLNVYYLDHGDGSAMADPPTLPKKTVFQLDPVSGKYVKGTTFVLATQQPWIPEPPTPDTANAPAGGAGN